MAEAKCRNNIKITRIKALQNKKHCNKSWNIESERDIVTGPHRKEGEGYVVNAK